MAIVLKWFRAFRLSYWRRCKSCYLRGNKCVCRRPSLTMEQIFFIEERKNKFGARNFSHVSDTAISGGSGSGSSTGTALSSGTSFGADYGPGEFYHATQQQPTVSSTALVRKHSGTMVSARGNNRSYSQDDMSCRYSGEYDSYYADSASARQRPLRQLPPSTSRPEDSALQVYNRKRPVRSGSRTSARMNSLGDSLIVRPSSSSSVRASINSDRMSIDNNSGSYNPQSRFYGASYAPSIQEDEDDAQARLNGLLLLPSPASSTSTLLEKSRYRQYY